MNRDKTLGAGNTSGGAFLNETLTVLKLVKEKENLDKVRDEVIEHNIFAKDSIEARRKTFNLIYQRYLEGQKESNPVVAIVNSRLSRSIKLNVLYYHYCLHDYLSYLLTTEKLFCLYNKGKENLGTNQVRQLIEEFGEMSDTVRNWSPQTTKKLGASYLAALRDFEILTGTQNKTLHRPFLPNEVFLYVVYYLLDEEKSPKEIFFHDDLLLWFLTERDRDIAFNELSSENKLEFQRAGSIFQLELPFSGLNEYVSELTGEAV